MLIEIDDAKEQGLKVKEIACDPSLAKSEGGLSLEYNTGGQDEELQVKNVLSETGVAGKIQGVPKVSGYTNGDQKLVYRLRKVLEESKLLKKMYSVILQELEKRSVAEWDKGYARIRDYNQDVQGDTKCGGDRIQDGREASDHVQDGTKCGNDRIQGDLAAMEKSSRDDKIQGGHEASDHEQGETKGGIEQSSDVQCDRAKVD